MANETDYHVKMMELFLNSFDRRRNYEWKLSLSIWTAALAFIALLIKGDLRIGNSSKAFFVIFLICWILASLLIFLIQTFFLIMVKLANDCDKKKAWFFEEKILKEELHIETGYRGTEVEKAFKKIKWAGGWWSIPVHLLITLTLFGLAGLVILCKFIIP